MTPEIQRVIEAERERIRLIVRERTCSVGEDYDQVVIVAELMGVIDNGYDPRHRRTP